MKLRAQSTIPKASLDSLLKAYIGQKGPGISVAVVRDGQVAYRFNAGQANVAANRPIDSLTQFWLASMSKQFTASAIYLLQSKNQLKTGASIRKYLKELPAMYEAVTIDMLVHHTSGIRDGFVLAAMQGKAQAEYTNANVLAALRAQQEFNFRPGTDYEYNNSGYVLLALAIERVSGIAYPEFMRKNIFLPLGMMHTQVSGKYTDVPGMAEGYNGSTAVHFAGNTYGSTGIISTVNDLARWMSLLQRPAKYPVMAKVAPLLMQAGRLSDGTLINYAGGLEKFLYRGRVVYGHPGADPGFRSQSLLFPATGLGLIGCTNNSSEEKLTSLLYAMVDIVQRDKPTMPAQALKDTTLLSTAWYYNGEGMPHLVQVKRFRESASVHDLNIGHSAYFDRRSDTLLSRAVVPVKSFTYRVPGLIDIDPYTGRQRMLTRIDLVTDTLRAASFAGIYQSGELNTRFTIASREGNLFFVLAPGMELPMRRIDLTDFMFDYHGTNYVRFRVNGFLISREGCRGLKFERVK